MMPKTRTACHARAVYTDFRLRKTRTACHALPVCTDFPKPGTPGTACMFTANSLARPAEYYQPR